MFLLTIALRVFTLVEFVVREALQKSQRVLSRLYDGNTKRATARPSAEQLLKAFSNLTLYSLSLILPSLLRLFLIFNDRYFH